MQSQEIQEVIRVVGAWYNIKRPTKAQSQEIIDIALDTLCGLRADAEKWEKQAEIKTAPKVTKSERPCTFVYGPFSSPAGKLIMNQLRSQSEVLAAARGQTLKNIEKVAEAERGAAFFWGEPTEMGLNLALTCIEYSIPLYWITVNEAALPPQLVKQCTWVSDRFLSSKGLYTRKLIISERLEADMRMLPEPYTTPPPSSERFNRDDEVDATRIEEALV